MSAEETLDVNSGTVPTLTVLVRGVPFDIPVSYVKNFSFFSTCAESQEVLDLTPEGRSLSFDLRAWPNLYKYLMIQKGEQKVTVPEENLPIADDWFHRLTESERALFGVTHVDVMTSLLLGIDSEEKARTFCTEWEKVKDSPTDDHQVAQRDKLNLAYASLKEKPSSYNDPKKLVVPTNDYMADLLGRLRYICTSVLFFLGGKTSGDNDFSNNLVKCCAGSCAWCLTGRTVDDNKGICQKAKLLCDGSETREKEWVEYDVDALKTLSVMFD